MTQDSSKTGSPTTVRLKICFINAFTRDVLEETDVTSTQTSGPDGDPQSAVRKAVFAVAMKAALKLAGMPKKRHALVLSVERTGKKASVELNLGYNDGLRVGDKMAVVRGNYLAGRIEVEKVSLSTSTGRIVEDRFGVKPEDVARFIIREGKSDY